MGPQPVTVGGLTYNPPPPQQEQQTDGPTLGNKLQALGFVHDKYGKAMTMDEFGQSLEAIGPMLGEQRQPDQDDFRLCVEDQMDARPQMTPAEIADAYGEEFWRTVQAEVARLRSRPAGQVYSFGQ